MSKDEASIKKKQSTKNEMDRRTFLKYSAGAILATGLSPALGCLDDESSGKNGPPNILFIYPDQHRSDIIGAAGHPFVQTPALDSLAESGVLFSRCHCPAPLCVPSRPSFWTGLLPHQHGAMTDGSYVDPPPKTTLASRIRDEAGYHTAYVGKTHLHETFYQNPPDFGLPHLDDYQAALHQWGFESVKELVGPNQHVGLRSGWTDFIGDAAFERFRAYMADYMANYKKNLQWWTPAPDTYGLSTEDHIDHYTGVAAADWIRRYNDSRPFFLTVGFPGPHSPFDANEELRNLYDPTDPSIPLGPIDPLIGPWDDLIRGTMAYMKGPTTAQDARRLHALYYAKVTLIDRGIASVLNALREKGLDDNTWIIYSSDHGEMLGDHQMIAKIVFFNSSVQVPLIIRPPKGALPWTFRGTGKKDKGKGRGHGICNAPWTCDGLVDGFDLHSTIAEIAGLVPQTPHGASLLSAIERGPNNPNSNIGKEFVVSENMGFAMIRNETGKLVVDFRQGLNPTQFYDLVGDPEERVNAINDPQFEDLRSVLFAKIKEVLNG